MRVKKWIVIVTLSLAINSEALAKAAQYSASNALIESCEKSVAQSYSEFSSSYCAAYIQGIIVGFKLSTGVMPMLKENDPRKAGIKLANDSVNNSFCPPLTSNGVPYEYTIAQDFVVKAKAVENKNKSNPSAEGGMLGLFILGHYPCKE
jgi:hypothetical protein